MAFPKLTGLNVALPEITAEIVTKVRAVAQTRDMDKAYVSVLLVETRMDGQRATVCEAVSEDGEALRFFVRMGGPAPLS